MALRRRERRLKSSLTKRRSGTPDKTRKQDPDMHDAARHPAVVPLSVQGAEQIATTGHILLFDRGFFQKAGGN
jgi:hypothetical protein